MIASFSSIASSLSLDIPRSPLGRRVSDRITRRPDLVDSRIKVWGGPAANGGVEVWFGLKDGPGKRLLFKSPLSHSHCWGGDGGHDRFMLATTIARTLGIPDGYAAIVDRCFLARCNAPRFSLSVRRLRGQIAAVEPAI